MLEAGPDACLVKPRASRMPGGTRPAFLRRWPRFSPGGLESDFEELAPILAQHRMPPEHYRLAENYGITICNDWIEDLERTYGVKL